MDFEIIRSYVPLFAKAFILTVKIGWAGILLSVLIGIVEVLKTGQQIIEANRKTSPNAAFGVFAAIFILYFPACYPIGRLAGYLEKRWEN